MIEIDGKKYYTKEEMQKAYDDFIYLLNFKDAMIECYKNQVNVLEEIVEKLNLKEEESDPVR